MVFSHLDKNGNAKMVDVSNKNETVRTATARALVRFSKDTYSTIKNGNNKKGDIINVSKIAGIMAAKQTSSLIPLCHPINISGIDIIFNFLDESYELEIISEVKINGYTGVEMEALVAVNIAALTIYDMCKAIDKSITITNIQLLQKTGGKSGDFKRVNQNG